MWLSSLTAKQRTALIGLAHDVVESDGLLDPSEELMMSEFKREMSLTSSEPTGHMDLEGIENIFHTKREQVIVLLNLLRLSYADGEFNVDEESLVKEIALAFEVEDEEFRRLDDWVRRLIEIELEARSMMASKP